MSKPKVNYYEMVQQLLDGEISKIKKFDAEKILKKLGFADRSKAARRENGRGSHGYVAKPIYFHNDLPNFTGFTLSKENDIEGHHLQGLINAIAALKEVQGEEIFDALKPGGTIIEMVNQDVSDAQFLQ